MLLLKPLDERTLRHLAEGGTSPWADSLHAREQPGPIPSNGTPLTSAGLPAAPDHDSLHRICETNPVGQLSHLVCRDPTGRCADYGPQHRSHEERAQVEVQPSQELPDSDAPRASNTSQDRPDQHTKRDHKPQQEAANKQQHESRHRRDSSAETPCFPGVSGRDEARRDAERKPATIAIRTMPATTSLTTRLKPERSLTEFRETAGQPLF